MIKKISIKYNRIEFTKVDFWKYINKGYKKRRKDKWIFDSIMRGSGLSRMHGKIVDSSIPLHSLYNSNRGTYGLERIEIDSEMNWIKLCFYNGRMSCPVIVIPHSLNTESDLKDLAVIVKVLNSEVSREHCGWGSNLDSGTYECNFIKT